jgi:hypothetical protein
MKSVMETFDLESAERVQLRLADEGIPSETQKVTEDGLEKIIVVVSDEAWELASVRVELIIEEMSPWRSATPCPKCNSVRIKIETAEDDGTVSTMGYRMICSECGYEWIQAY